MGCTYYATGKCNVATLGQIQICKMASRMAAATLGHFLFNNLTPTGVTTAIKMSFPHYWM